MLLSGRASSVSVFLIITLLLLPEGTKFVHGWWFTNHKCRHDGKIYPVGAIFGHTYNHVIDKCIAYKCTLFGKVSFPTTKNCNAPTTITMPPPTTPPPPTTTIPPPTTPPTRKPGCYHNGQHYPLGTLISSGKTGTWCHVTYCDRSGQVVSGDDFNCGKSTTTPPPTPTAPTTTQPDIGGRLLKLLEENIKN